MGCLTEISKNTHRTIFNKLQKKCATKHQQQRPARFSINIFVTDLFARSIADNQKYSIVQHLANYKKSALPNISSNAQRTFQWNFLMVSSLDQNCWLSKILDRTTPNKLQKKCTTKHQQQRTLHFSMKIFDVLYWCWAQLSIWSRTQAYTWKFFSEICNAKTFTIPRKSKIANRSSNAQCTIKLFC